MNVVDNGRVVVPERVIATAPHFGVRKRNKCPIMVNIEWIYERIANVPLAMEDKGNILHNFQRLQLTTKIIT